ncbi:MAG: hypothetical protein OEQ29_10900 [Alphaproteobacteria bacterium]|nr:hypothetical protein [Alphaproteobacteria bacterium]
MSEEASGGGGGFLKWFLGFIVFIVLTGLTQIGGVVYVVSALLISWLLGSRDWNFLVRWIAHLVGFACIYVAVTVAALPPLAAEFGRHPLPCLPSARRPYGAQHPIYCLLNRHYATPSAHRMLAALTTAMNKRFPGTTVLYLDAGFPFLDGFPMLPHLLHDDGRSIDLAFFYTNRRGVYQRGRTRSPIGYWAFERPRAGDPRPCLQEGGWGLRWNLGFLQRYWRPYTLDQKRTAAMVEWLVTDGPKLGVERLYLEPHLINRFGVASPLLKFQGCRAERHDDHIQVRLR